MTSVPNVLSIAGSDPSGGAGIQADLKTFAALGCYGMAAITALTAQNTQGVSAVHIPPADFLGAQLDAVFKDIDVQSVKIGMLASGDIVDCVAKRLSLFAPRFIVLDPVLVATSGDRLGGDDVVEPMCRVLLPMADVITPNVPEAARLSGLAEAHDEAGLEVLARALHAKGAKAVLVKGGHLSGTRAVDVLFDGQQIHRFEAERIVTRNTHGTGCTLSSAIAAYLALGFGLVEAVARAKDYLTGALRAADDLHVGHSAQGIGQGIGHGPVHHGWQSQ